MLTQSMIDALNRQVALEGYASFLYLSMSGWCEKEGLAGCAAFMRRQADEERAHMLRIFDYLHEMDSHALTPGINQPPHEFGSIKNLFEEVYAHEKKVTAAINQLVALSYEEKDHTTLQFLQWYVAEQREEEALMRNLLDRIRLIGDGPMSLYYIDKEVDAINKAELSAEGEAEEA
jgi:ferritin